MWPLLCIEGTNSLKFILDIHCHTVNSGHAYSTVSENAAHAKSVGLTHIGIADHGPAMPGGAHVYHFFNQWILPDYINGVRVFKGAEVNIINTGGEVDLEPEMLKRMDFVIASMHRGVIPPSNSVNHTRAMINAMENPHVHILGHPGDFWYEIDIHAVVKAAAQTNTIIEINNQSLNPDSHRNNGNGPFIELLSFCKEYGVPVIASSDAHFHTLVGEVSRAKALIEDAGMGEELVLNTSVERLMNAINRKKVTV
jgi:putative hydrolase